MTEMLEVVIDSIRVSLMSQNRIVILRERDSERYLPIWIGVYEAEAITIALQEVEVSRPLTHDLIKNIFKELNAHIIRVEVTALKDDTFYGSIVAEMDSRIVHIDSRPSDALAIAVRAHVPILVSRNVMESAGIVPENDLQELQKETPPANSPAPQAEESDVSEDRLSIFTDFIEKLDLDDLDKDKPDQEPEE